MVKIVRILTKPTTLLRSKLINETYEGWIKKGDKVLDIGCGTCVVADEVRKKFGVDIVGHDIIDHNIGIDIPLIISDYIPLEGSYDIVMLNDVLHHCEPDTQVEVLKRARKISKSILVFELKESFLANLIDKVLYLIHYRKAKMVFHYRTQKGWTNFFKSLGFKVEYKPVKKKWYYPLYITHIV